ncbi:MAG TPA: DUF5989 family protein [candidate division Zixibacteria bacterium]|nr:DUF5989 family protein [candidate division Zixibacteria bacterium]
MPSRTRIFSELFLFVKSNKKWWITPILAVLLLMSGLILLTESSAVAPFIYSLF